MSWAKILHCMEMLGPEWQLRMGIEKRREEDRETDDEDEAFAYASLYRLCPDEGWSDKEMLFSNGLPRHPADRTLDRIESSVTCDPNYPDQLETLLRLAVKMLEDKLKRGGQGP